MHATINKTVSLLLANALVATAAAAQDSIVLPLDEEIQEQSLWCWVASSTAVINYYNNEGVQQCEVAEYTRTVSQPMTEDLGDVDCCVSADFGCNATGYIFFYPGSIEDILHNWTIESRRVHQPISLAQTAVEISLEQPFVLMWRWYVGGGHFLVMNGIDGDLVHYMDPWFGEGHHVALYDWVVDDGIHEWTDTLTTTLSAEGGNGSRNGEGGP